MASFALQSALSSVVKVTGATCGAVLSFWDPDSATLTSVEINEGNTMIGSSHINPATRALTDEIAAMLEEQQQQTTNTLDENSVRASSSSFRANSVLASAPTTKQSQQQQQPGENDPGTKLDSTTTTRTTAMENKKKATADDDENGNDDDDDDDAGRASVLLPAALLLGDAVELTSDKADNDDSEDVNNNSSDDGVDDEDATSTPTTTRCNKKNNKRQQQRKQKQRQQQQQNSMMTNNKDSSFSPPSPMTRGLGSTLRSQGRSKLLSSTLGGVPSAVAGMMMSSPAGGGGAGSRPLYSCAARCVAVCGEPSPILGKAITPNLQQAVAKSGIAVHCTSESSPYLCVPITSNMSAVHHLYSAVSKRLLEEGGFTQQSVVVGLLILIGNPPLPPPASHHETATAGDNNNESSSFANDSFVVSKHVAFRAEDESVAMTVCRTVLSEILTTPEGMVCPEKSIYSFLNHASSSNDSPTRQRAATTTTNASGLGKNSSGSSRNMSASFRRAAKSVKMITSALHQKQQKDDPSAVANASFSMRMTHTMNNNNNPLASFAGDQTLNNNNNNTNHSASFRSPASGGGGGGGGANLANLNSSFASNPLGGGGVSASDNFGTTGNNNLQMLPPAMQRDFLRSTQQRRIPQVIRIPDSSIFLTQRGILSQKASEFQSLPDLPEVRRCIEEAEVVLSSLRSQNIDLLNVTNQKSNIFGGATSLQEGMERYEIRISNLRNENVSLRNYIEMLTHRLNSVLARGSLSREQSEKQAYVLGDALQGMFDRNEFDGTFRPLSSSSASSSSSKTRGGGGGRPPSSSPSFPHQHQQQQQASRSRQQLMSVVVRPPSMRRPADVLDRPLPASVLLEKKATEGLDKLKREVAAMKNGRRFNG